MPANRRAAGEQHRFLFSSFLRKHLVNRLVIEIGIVVVHPFRVAAVVVHHICGDSFAKVGFKAVHPLAQQFPQLSLIPLHRLRIGEVHHRKPGLPQVPLPDIAVGLFQQVSLVRRLVKGGAVLGQVGVDPDTDFQPLLVHPLQHPLNIREHILVPFKAAPFVLLHPEAVKVEDTQRNVPLRHAVHKAADRFLIIGGGEGGGQPQAKAPGGGKGGPAGEGGIMGQHILPVLPADDHKVQPLSRHAELHLGDSL